MGSALAASRRAAFSAGVSSGLLSYLVLFGSLFVTPFFLENGRGLSAAAAGACLTALSVATALVSPLAGRLADAVSARLLTVAGMLVSAVALALLAAQHGATVRVVVGLALLGLGIGLFVPANNAAIMSSVPREQLGAASGMLNMARSLGTALELSLTGRVFAAVAGARARPELVSRGYTAAMLFLAALSLVAALLAAARREGRLHPDAHAVVNPI